MPWVNGEYVMPGGEDGGLFDPWPLGAVGGNCVDPDCDECVPRWRRRRVGPERALTLLMPEEAAVTPPSVSLTHSEDGDGDVRNEPPSASSAEASGSASASASGAEASGSAGADPSAAAVTIERLRPGLVPPPLLEGAFAAFAAELRALCRTKSSRAAIDIDPPSEAQLWNEQQGGTSELCAFVALGGASQLEGLVCASVCVRGRHERHRPADPRVAFGAGRASSNKRARGDDDDDGGGALAADGAVGAEALVWHLWVAPTARRRGVARRLVDAVRSHAAALAVDAVPLTQGRGGGAAVRVVAEVLPQNATALAFWRSVLRDGSEEHTDAYARLAAGFA